MNEKNPFSLTGKTILVTGASSGIGKAAAIACSRLGARVVVCGRDAGRLAGTLAELEIVPEETHLPVRADLTVPADLETLVKTVPVLDGIVNCAGVSRKIPFQFSKREKFLSLFDVNLFAQSELCRTLLNAKKIRGNASIVMVSSVAGNTEFYPGNGIYGATKAALTALSKMMALELAPRGIRVNAVLPGMVETPMIHNGELSDEDLEKEKQNYPLGRYGKPEEIAWGIVYLLSEASAWTTGTTLVIDGGSSLK